MDTFFTLVALMSETDFPCFNGKPSPLPALQTRFSQGTAAVDSVRNAQLLTGKTIRESAAFMYEEVTSSFKGIRYVSSIGYDVFQ